jgi:Protein of unknown function (DUF3168)
MENLLRRILIDWLATDPSLAAELNAITEEVPSRTSAPWLGIAASASIDWSTKDRRGREVRIAIELHTRGEEDGETGTISAMVEDRIAALPAAQPGLRIVSTTFLRARTEQRAQFQRAVLLEYRFRLLAD